MDQSPPLPAVKAVEDWHCWFSGCPEIFASEKAVSLHYEHTHRAHPRTCPHPACRDRLPFNSFAEVDKHVARAHPGQDPFQCEHCAFRTHKCDLLRQHMQGGHGKRDDYPCSHIGCEKKFDSHKNLVKHKKIHRKAGRPSRVKEKTHTTKNDPLSSPSQELEAAQATFPIKTEQDEGFLFPIIKEELDETIVFPPIKEDPADEAFAFMLKQETLDPSTFPQPSLDQAGQQKGRGAQQRNTAYDVAPYFSNSYQSAPLSPSIKIEFLSNSPVSSVLNTDLQPLLDYPEVLVIDDEDDSYIVVSEAVPPESCT